MAADTLVQDLMSAEAIDELGQLVAGRRPIILPVIADEASGYNAIPDAMAEGLASWFGFPMGAGEIVQISKVGHTKADGWHRLVTPAEFNGEVRQGSDYLLFDDHVDFGGTLPNLRGFIETRGGHVNGMTTLTETRAARQIGVRSETLKVLCNKHGHDLAAYWEWHFGHGLDCLTEVEAGYLCRVESFAAVQNRMAAAAELAHGRGLSAVSIRTGG